MLILQKGEIIVRYHFLTNSSEDPHTALEAIADHIRRYQTDFPERILGIGGGLGLAAYSLIVPAAFKEAQQRTLSRYWEKLEIKKSTVVPGAIGAACLVWKYLKKEGDEM